MQYAAFKVGKADPSKGVYFRNYRIIGDDVVIFDREVALMYKKLQEEVLGVKISPQKSYTPHYGRYPIEFAKQLFCNGVCFTPLPGQLLDECWRINPSLYIPILFHILNDWSWTNSFKGLDSSHLAMTLFRVLVPYGTRLSAKAAFTDPIKGPE